MTLPSLLLVPGSWHKADHLKSLVDELPDVDVHTVALTSSGDDPAKLGDMYQDAAQIATAVAAIDRPVVVCAHSYGGIPVTQALAGASNVKRIIYLAAFLLDVGESMLSSVGGTPAPWWKVHGTDGEKYVEALDPVEIFYGDVDPELAQDAVSRLGYTSYSANVQKLTEVAWKAIPSTYVLCEADNAFPPFAQELFAQRAGRIHRMNTSHSPFLSQPAALAQILRDELASADVR
ncbi:alpha/beta hydrolase [Amycolatopsis rhabdoformis]|uniref:Alpha/beta hydrolase n=1 Tax=Amycolatopsis rhabdoformis TaxID=1448059 RepID=A0ABZ1ICY1_9PSEU|nr:alpha/beta hydrolase [Amycolatopsis rhabdoformis]WSE32107.1 alpha/beta hydrolase [Amycolatopsis rhabdoformis]